MQDRLRQKMRSGHVTSFNVRKNANISETVQDRDTVAI